MWSNDNVGRIRWQGNIAITEDPKIGQDLVTKKYVDAAIPSGVILMWSGSVASIPSGWHLCDGTTGTPDLRNKFIVGAGSTYDPADTGGEVNHTLIKSEMPSHYHGLQMVDKSGNFTLGLGTSFLQTAILGSKTTNSEGGDGAHNNLPPYYALAFIMKL